MAKKGSDGDNDVSSEGDGYLYSQEEDHRSDSFVSLDGEIFWTFSLLICLDAYNKFVLLSFSTLLETICLKIWAQPLPMNRK